MITVNKLEGKTFVFTKGALETVLPLCNSILSDSDVKSVKEDDKNSLMQAYHSMMDEGLRVIAFAYREINDIDIGMGEEMVAVSSMSLNVIHGYIGIFQ